MGDLAAACCVLNAELTDVSLPPISNRPAQTPAPAPASGSAVIATLKKQKVAKGKHRGPIRVLLCMRALGGGARARACP